MPTLSSEQRSSAGPSAFWLAAGFVLAGLGTVMLGPILPTLSREWTLTDAQGGILLGAKFFGGFLGGVSVLPRLRLAILTGCVLCFAGFGSFALCHGLAPAAAALFVGGLGLGQLIASTNILVGRRFREHTGSALSSLNAFWSLGAVATGLLAAALLPHFALRGPLMSFAALFLAVGLGGLVQIRRDDQPASAAVQDSTALPRLILIKFALLLFLYGGLETCLAGWLTTYTLRFTDTLLLGGQSALVLMWMALTVGRALSAAVLRYLHESTIQRLGLALAAAFIASLGLTHHAASISLVCIALGLSLAPFFPSTFALLIKHSPSAREAGFILAVSGLGAALFPWMMGVISTRSGSLRIAMAVPLALALALLLLTFWQRRSPQSRAEYPLSPSEEAAKLRV